MANNWGGSRENAGRKKLSDGGRVQIQISLQQSEIDLLKELSEKNGMNRSRFIATCVTFWKDNH